VLSRLTGRGNYLCRGDISGRLDPFYRVPNFLDGVDERADVTGDVVEKVNCGHCCAKTVNELVWGKE
jgi:hypothetical protein